MCHGCRRKRNISIKGFGENGAILKHFVVVACPSCGWVRGAEACVQKIYCPGCGKKNELKKLVFLSEVEGQKNLPETVAAVREKLNKETVVELKEPSAKAHTGQKRRKPTVKELCEVLSNSGNRRFTKEEFFYSLEEHGYSDGDKLLKDLMESGLMYEPSSGVLAWLG